MSSTYDDVLPRQTAECREGADTLLGQKQAYYSNKQVEDIGKLQLVKDYVEQNELESAEIENGQVAETETALANCKYVNEVYLQTWARGIYTYDSTQQAMLESVGNQNPVQGGICVYGAWVMLDWDINAATEEEGGRLLSSLNNNLHQENRSKIKLYPNPAKDQINILTYENGIFEIKDVTGNLLFKKLLNNRREILNIDLPSGLYIYYYSIDDRNSEKGKLITIK